MASGPVVRAETRARRDAPTILNVDDHPDGRKALTTQLTAAGFAVEEAATGGEALRKALRRPDLILLDLHLPDINGFEVCRRLKSDPALAAIPVIHISAAYQGSIHWTASLDSGADAYLAKPCTPDVLLATIRAVLRTRRAEDSLREEIERRREVEMALRVSERRWRSLVASVPDFIVTTDAELRLTFTNRPAPGVEMPDVIGTSALAFVVPEHRAEVEGHLRRALASGEAVEYEAEGLMPDGSRHWYRVRAAPLDPNASSGGLVLVASDVTGKRDTQSAMNDAQQRHVTAQRRAEGLVDSEARILEAIARGAPFPETLARILAALEEHVQGARASFHLWGSSAPQQVHGPRPPGARSSPIRGGDGRFLGEVAVAREGREPDPFEVGVLEACARLAGIAVERARAEEALRTSEDRYRGLFESSRDALVIVDREGVIMDANRAAVELFARPREEIRGLSAAELFAEDGERLRLEQELERLGAVRDLEVRLRRRGGGTMVCQVSVAAYRDDHGRPAGYQGTVRDITPQRQAELSMRELSRRLLQAQEDERRRIAGELHDTTAQDISAIAMQLAVLRERSGLDPAGRRIVEECEAIASRAVRDVRTLSYVLHPPLLEEAGLAAALGWLAEGFSARSGIEVALRLPESLGRFSRDVEIVLFRTVQEGLTNAHRHSGSSRVRVDLAARDGHLRLEVRDWGRGLAELADGRPPRLGVGLLGMRERIRQIGGVFEIAEARPGFAVRVSVPTGGRA